MGAHLKDGQFQSDKYPTCPPGKVPLSVKDPMAQDLLWDYAQRRRSVDAEFSADLETALRRAGYEPSAAKQSECVAMPLGIMGEIIGYIAKIKDGGTMSTEYELEMLERLRRLVPGAEA